MSFTCLRSTQANPDCLVLFEDKTKATVLFENPPPVFTFSFLFNCFIMQVFECRMRALCMHAKRPFFFKLSLYLRIEQVRPKTDKTLLVKSKFWNYVTENLSISWRPCSKHAMKYYSPS